MSEYQASLDTLINIKAHDGKCVNVDGLEAQDKLTTTATARGIPSVNNKVCVSNV